MVDGRTVTRQITELRSDLRRVEERLDGRIDGLERKMDAHHDAVKLILADILDRLPARTG